MDNTVIINGRAYTGVKTIVVTTAEGKQVQYFTDPVRTINGIAPDENGNIVVETGGVDDAELTAAVEAAIQEAKDSGEFDITEADKQSIIDSVKNSIKPVLTVNGTEPDENGNVVVKGGSGTSILGTYSSEEELRAAHPTGSTGDSYTINSDLWVWSEDASDWVNAGTIQGPQGDTYNLAYADYVEISRLVYDLLSQWSGGEY